MNADTRIFPPEGPVTSAVLMLHGLGSNADDLIGLAPYLAPALPNTLFVSPNAPEPCDMAPMGYQWFSLRDWSEASMLNGIRNTAPVVERYVEEIAAAYKLPFHRIALLGFSQGTMMALHVAPRMKELLAGVVGFSGALVAPQLLPAEVINRPPVLLAHGEYDTVVPFEAMAAATNALTSVNIAVQTVKCDGLSHSIDDTGLQQAGQFLYSRLT